MYAGLGLLGGVGCASIGSCFVLCDIVWTGADGNAADLFLRFEHSSSMSRRGRKAGSMSGVLGCVGVRSLSKNK